MDRIQFEECDVLIAGAGLAGLRAGIAALSRGKKRRVLVVTTMKGPSGSSFTNRNNALGMIVCHDDREKELFVKSALEIASPGTINPDLVRIMAEESGRYFHDLVSAGIQFNKTENGELMRVSGCFMRESSLAYVFTDLKDAYDKMKKRIMDLGGRMIEGYQLVDVLQCYDNRIGGAVFINSENTRIMAVKSKAFVAATGGTAGLFRRHISGSGLPGFLYGILEKTDARFVNAGYVQFLWYDLRTMEHWPCWSLRDNETVIMGKDGKPVHLPDELRGLCVSRSRHIPLYHGGKDSAIDRFLVNESMDDGTIQVRENNFSSKQVALFAHASNGGIQIDEQAGTNVPGLFACGECAGGMHGANRVGGAMVLSTQVFGQRAGDSAVKFAEATEFISNNQFSEKVKETIAYINIDNEEYACGTDLLSRDLGKTAGPQSGMDCSAISAKYRLMLETARDWRWIRTILTALIILENMS